MNRLLLAGLLALLATSAVALTAGGRTVGQAARFETARLDDTSASRSVSPDASSELQAGARGRAPAGPRAAGALEKPPGRSAFP